MSVTSKTIQCKNNFGEEIDVPLEKFIFRPSAYGFIVQNEKVLVMRNKSNGKIWFPGGGIEMYERLEGGLKREIKEETGLEVKVGKLMLAKENFFYYQPLDEAYHAFLFFYVCRPLTNNVVADEDVDDFESEKPRWENIADVKSDDISDLSEEIDTCLRQLIAY
jgi:ADP-ribose pyrophosphatase YjhB (NUDIX family)